MPNRNPIAYLAGPYGFSEAWRLFYYQDYLPRIACCGFDIRDPWVLTSKDIIDGVLRLPYGQIRKDAWRAINPLIGRNNFQGIKESDIIIAGLDGTDVDSGTAAEIGAGFALNKSIQGYRGDFRPCSDNEGCIVNLQVEYFITASGGTIAGSLDDLIKNLLRFREIFISLP